MQSGDLRQGRALWGVVAALLLGALAPGRSQEAVGALPEVARVSDDRWWAVGGQVTVDTFFVPPFPSPYASPAVSFGPGPDLGWSLVASVLLVAHLWRGATVVAVPEYSNGAGAPNVSGLSGYPDGNMIRVAKVGAAPYLARAYFHQDIALDGRAAPDEDEPQPEGGFMPTGSASLGRPRPPHRLEFTIGKFGSNDFLDVAEASSDPRHKFMNWALMQNGAWDYVADTRGYTWGVEVGVETPHWAARAMAALMPTAPNGPVFDGNLSTSGSYMLEGQYGWGEGPHEGSVRLLGYVNRGNMGNYGTALDVAAAGPPGTRSPSASPPSTGRSRWVASSTARSGAGTGTSQARASR